MTKSAARPQVLLLATQCWPTGARLGLAMRAAGFCVSLWAPRHHPLLLTGVVRSHHAHEALRPLASLTAAVLAARPDLIVPCDDLATIRLQQLAERAAMEPSESWLLRVIERSVGPAGDLACLTSRAHILDLAASAGINVPANAAIRSVRELRTWFEQHGFPAYLKADGTSGGIGVRPVRNYEEAAAAHRLLDAPPHVLRALKRLSIDRDPTLLGPLFHREHPSISVQQAVAGRDANSAIFCWQGRVLASISVEVIATRYQRGPSTVVRRIHHPAMDRAAQLLAARLHLSGFYGLDFILDDQRADDQTTDDPKTGGSRQLGTPWLLEMNSRATQVAHLALGPGHDLAAAACGAITGEAARPRPLLTEAETIALFPQEWHRDPRSELLKSAFHDVPWEAPALVRAYVNERPSWRHIFNQQYWRKRRVARPAFAIPAAPESISRGI